MRLFASLFCYGLVRAHPTGEAHHVIAAEVEKGLASEWPGFRTLARLRELGDVEAAFDGSTLIAKARCRAAGRFMATGADLWVSIDEDIEAPVETLRALVGVPPEHGIVTAPYVRRDGAGPAFALLEEADEVELARGIWGRVALTYGHGLTAYPQYAIERLFNSYPELGFRHRGDYCVALFLESVQEGEWVGEDLAFCLRAAMANVPSYALCDVETTHAGKPYLLTRAQVSETPTVQNATPLAELPSSDG